METWPIVRCTGPEPCQVTRLDSFSLNIPQGEYELLTFKSGWGNEFEPRRETLAGRGRLELESDAGRSSRLFHPWFALQRGSGEDPLRIGGLVGQLDLPL